VPGFRLVISIECQKRREFQNSAKQTRAKTSQIEEKTHHHHHHKFQTKKPEAKIH
jgi:hypothetical protein